MVASGLARGAGRIAGFPRLAPPGRPGIPAPGAGGPDAEPGRRHLRPGDVAALGPARRYGAAQRRRGPRTAGQQPAAGPDRPRPAAAALPTRPGDAAWPGPAPRRAGPGQRLGAAGT